MRCSFGRGRSSRPRGITTAVPQIAADSLQRPSRQSRANCGPNSVAENPAIRFPSSLYGDRIPRNRSGAIEMRRPDFIAGRGSAAACPFGVGAQRRIRRTGVRVTAFAQALQELDWTDGRNLRIDYRFAGMDAERIRKYTRELAALRSLRSHAGSRCGTGSPAGGSEHMSSTK
jgi:hypothetical protein